METESSAIENIGDCAGNDDVQRSQHLNSNFYGLSDKTAGSVIVEKTIMRTLLNGSMFIQGGQVHVTELAAYFENHFYGFFVLSPNISKKRRKKIGFEI